MRGSDYRKAIAARRRSVKLAFREGLISDADYRTMLAAPPPADPDIIRLQFAVDLANAAPFMAWPEELRQAFSKTFAWFIAATPGARAKGGVDLQRLQDLAHAAIEGFVLTGRSIVGFGQLDEPLIVELRRETTRTTARASGSPEDVFVLTLAFLLISDAGAQLRRCADPKCSRFFLRQGKMEHCSRRCARRRYMEAYRKS